MRNWLIPLTLAGSMTASLAWAGPYADAEAALRAAYGHYRIALFATNMGKPKKAATSAGAGTPRTIPNDVDTVGASRLEGSGSALLDSAAIGGA